MEPKYEARIRQVQDHKKVRVVGPGPRGVAHEAKELDSLANNVEAVKEQKARAKRRAKSKTSRKSRRVNRSK